MKDKYWLNILLSFIQTFGNSFYPLYPPMEGTPLDFSLAPEALQISCVPDILILSSDLAHFMKVMTALFSNGNYIHLGYQVLRSSLLEQIWTKEYSPHSLAKVIG